MALIEDMKTAVRLSSNDEGLVAELDDLVGAALKHLHSTGVNETWLNSTDSELSPLIKAAVRTYVKANWGYDNPDAEKFSKAYEILVRQLSLTSEYREVKPNA